MSSSLLLAAGSAISIAAAAVMAWNDKGHWGWFLIAGLLLASALDRS
ncbi:hypothetical protein [Agrobacterium tumefaciens]|nr:hypothetical protein [Agrobacterium tumefaciens]UNZ49469.1 hypothetical protein MLE07_08735 [Agrobacterium tumefaciens]